ncbi:cation:proton antiporter [Candidatus Liberibacter sp.]|uniref:cation:proton antiporter domain-containing protein n=1 Tax=Candidatus Liberibacter sp. TaxID=34022 RepID=UPI0015F50657|nr:cation:proton antiporter [Candidatus Liberibacter sp.]MBA5723740.1 cation:proton antiporter [Candidatus Liberibacter sp.]
MLHETPLMSTIIWGFVLAFLFGAMANRFRLPTLVGYLVAGILVGPRTPGFVASQSLVPELAEIGIILLMFGVGLHFSLKDLLSVRGIAIPGAIIQIFLGTFLGCCLGMGIGWSLGGSLIFGLALSIASTVVLLKALQEHRILETDRGRIAVGWLIVEDLVIVLALVFIPAAINIHSGASLSSDPLVFIASRLTGIDFGIAGVILITLLKVMAFVGVMLIFGRRIIPFILHKIFYTGSRELFRLGVLAIALGVAYGASKLFGVTLSLGAFFAGMVLAESELSQSAAQESLPMRDAFSVLFFVSVGMSFNPQVLISSPFILLMTIMIIIFGKSLIAFMIVIAFKRSVMTALTISASLAQIGEFSFILVAHGVKHGLIPENASDLVMASAIISIILNPLVFALFGYIRPLLESFLISFWGQTENEDRECLVESCAFARAMPSSHTATISDQEEETVSQKTILTDHAVLVGYGRIGTIIAQNLKAAGISFLVIEESEKRIEELRALGIDAVYGNATTGDVLLMANIVEARSLVVSIPNAFEAAYITEEARKVNPSILIIAVAQSEAEVEHLTKYGADTVVMSARVVAFGMLDRLNQVHHEKVVYDQCTDVLALDTQPKKISDSNNQSKADNLDQ